MNWLKDTPWWVLGIALALASIEPITHLGLKRIDNEHAVRSGLHTPDSSIYLACMRMLDNDFFSPYATYYAPNGPNDPAFLPTPFHWLYAVVGELGRWFGIGEFMFLGLANGFFGFVYLIVVYRFLRTAVPDLANVAFVLWSLGGGLGGVVYLTAMIWSSSNLHELEPVLFRFIMYELIEGPGLYPILHIPRLYYTASLALGFGFLSALINGLRIGCSRHLVFAGILLLGCAIINVRFGAFAWSIALIYLLCRPELGGRQIASIVLSMFMVVAAAAGVLAVMQWSRPIFTETALAIVRESLWPSGFVSAAILFLPLFATACWNGVRTLPRLPRVLCGAGVGYLLILIPSVIAHHVYYGNFWRAGDQAALAVWSDVALLGAAAGAVYVWLKLPRDVDPADGDAHEWFLVWGLAYMVVGMSAFGQGWGVGLAPQRFLAMLGVPLVVGAAAALAHLRNRSKSAANVYTGAIVACGLCSIIVGSLSFQGAVGRSPDTAAYAYRHPELITPEDAALLDELEPGRIVLTAPEFADAVAMRPGMRVIGGIGATDLSDESSLVLDNVYNKFFMKLTGPDQEFDAFRDPFGVDYLLIPHNPVYRRPQTEERALNDRLRLVSTAGDGKLYTIRDE